MGVDQPCLVATVARRLQDKSLRPPCASPTGRLATTGHLLLATCTKLSAMDRGELEGLDREALVVRAQAAGIRRARILTRPELIDELLRKDPSADEAQLRKSRGFFGRARDLVARVVERGLHLPDAADRIRTLTGGHDTPSIPPRPDPQALPTVTLAEIYAAQGHPKRAIDTLRRVLEREPDHVVARGLLTRLEDEAYVPPPPPLPPELEVEATASTDADAEPTAAAAWAPEECSTARYTTEEEGEAIADAPAAQAGQRSEEDDSCIAIPVSTAEGAARTFVRWRVSSSAIAAQKQARPHGRFVVRAYVVTPNWDGPLTETRDHAIEDETGERTLQDLPEASIVRVAVGWLDADTFVSFTHSPALEFTDGRELAIWTPGGYALVASDDPRASSFARALDGARRAAG